MPDRLGGQRGAIYLAGSTSKLADSYLWQFEPQQTVLDASIKGENWKRYAADVAEGQVRVQSFVPFPGTESPLTRVLGETLVSPTGGGTPVDFMLDITDGNRTLVGQGYIVRTQLHVVRDGIVTDELTIQVDGAPTVIN